MTRRTHGTTCRWTCGTPTRTAAAPARRGDDDTHAGKHARAGDDDCRRRGSGGGGGQGRITKYRGFLASSSPPATFIPLAFGFGGAWGDAAMAFFHEAVRRTGGSRSGPEQSSRLAYWMRPRRFSVVGWRARGQGGPAGWPWMGASGACAGASRLMQGDLTWGGGSTYIYFQTPDMHLLHVSKSMLP